MSSSTGSTSCFAGAVSTLPGGGFVLRPSIPKRPADPPLVVLFTWLAAQPAHIAKYTAAYRTLYPSSTIVIVRSDLWQFMSGWVAHRQHRAALSTIRQVVALDALVRRASVEKHTSTAAGAAAAAAPPIVVHVFSNGGLMAYTRMLRMAECVFPRHVAVIDSNPGYFQFWPSYVAMAMGHPVHAKVAAFLYVLGTWIRSRVLRIGPTAAESAALLMNSAKVLNITQRRVYLYSNKDYIIPYRDVEHHGKVARQRGLKADLHLFDQAPHVQLAKKEPERYWNIIKTAWAEVVADFVPSPSPPPKPKSLPKTLPKPIPEQPVSAVALAKL